MYPEISDKMMSYMSRALELACRGVTRVSPNPRTGAVVVCDGRVIGEGRHEQCGGAHAEVNALKDIEDARGCDLYVTLEPCCHCGRTGPCSDMIISKKISRVFVGMIDPNPLVAGQGVQQLRDAGIKVVSGVMEEQCRAINQPFIKFMKQKSPYIIVKAAVTLDGFMADTRKHSKWISGGESRVDVHRMRAQFDAVMVGMGTVRADDPQLTVRDVCGQDPARIIFDPRGELMKSSKLIQTAADTRLFILTAADSDPSRMSNLEDAGAVIIPVDGPEKICLREGLAELSRFDIQSVLVEGGGRLHSLLADMDLIDRIDLYIAPKMLGEGVRMLHIPPRLMSESEIFLDHSWQASGSDMHFTGYLKKY